ncbi:hypothetical protein GGR54DRAFT_629296 [Hypoxylon sp. NC1633]|nr:hypothetical protein GGR54DRAFT_629296 [Hypoxylon sp. NC1633]
MDYQHFAYPEAMQLPVYVENALMDTSIDGMIDPVLKPSASPWAPPQIQRYLADSNKSSLFGYPLVDPVTAEVMIRRNDGVTPLPPSLLHRRDSPSFSHTSSTTSSMLSPPRDGDYYQAHSPPTPTDTTVMSPFFNMSPSDRDQLQRFTGLADACVKPVDINPFQETPEGYCDDGNSRSAFPLRGYSMSSDDNCSCIEMCGGAHQVGLGRPVSPERLMPEVKEEIHIPEPSASYPAFESEDEMMSHEDPEPLNLKHEDEDDDEYKPNQKQKRTKYMASRYTRSRKRQSDPVPVPDAKRPKVEPGTPTAMNRSIAKPVLQGAKGHFSCSKCSKKVSFKDESGLQTHIKKQHTRPFVCVFGFAGCTSTFASKNEWKRHCSSQHLVLHYWVCQQDQCSKAPSKPSASAYNRCSPPSPQNNCSPGLPRGTIFNRKDLYTQHLRRMHIPLNLKKQVKQRKPAPEWEARERAHQDGAKRTRCDLPTHMRCPAIGCATQFDGPNAWDDRMEHVAKHLEKAVTGSEPPVEFGGEHDRTLMDWATRADVAIVEKGERGRWKLRNPLKSNSGLTVETLGDQDGEEDAEGEEVDD